MARKPSSKKPVQKELLTLEVELIDGPMSPEFLDTNPKSVRTIEIRGDQTLAQLHEIIFDAFDREEEHLYQFELGNRPNDANARRYVLPFGGDDEDAAGTVKTRLSSLNLRKGDFFFYWFDFGDDWWHRIEVKAVSEDSPKGKYPRITERIGESPPQYDYDEFEDEEYLGDFDIGEMISQEVRLEQPEPSPEEWNEEMTSDAACLVGEMHLRNEELTKAIEAFTRAIEINPTVDAYEGRARACRMLAKQDEAIVKQLR